MYSRTYQHQPTSVVSRPATMYSTASVLGFYTATLTTDLLPGEGIVLHVSQRTVGAWTAMFGPDDVNGGKTISGQNSAGQLGAFNVTGNSVNGQGAHLISFHTVGARIASGTSFLCYTNPGGAIHFNVYRIQGNARLQNYENIAGTLAANTVYGIQNINRQGGATLNPGSNTRGSLGGYRRNVASLQCITTTNGPGYINGVASFFSILTSISFTTGTWVGASAQKWDLTYTPFNTQYLFRTPNGSYCFFTTMSFVI